MYLRLYIILPLTCLIIGAGITGCATKQSGIEPYNVKKLGEIGAEINRNPDQTDSLLSKYDLTKEKFRNLLREISSSPKLSKRYREAFREAQSQMK